MCFVDHIKPKVPLVRKHEKCMEFESGQGKETESSKTQGNVREEFNYALSTANW